MLAKDWCYSFSAQRTGHPRDQAHRRQRKWKLIERWKMQELIALLPSLMHLSLLLFSIGLCVYLWDLNQTTAIPVVCVAGAFLLFYIWSSITASIVEDFPYTTIFSRFIRSKYMQILYPPVMTFGRFMNSLLGILYSGMTNLYIILVIVLASIAAAFSGFLLILDRCSFRWFAKTWDDVQNLIYLSMEAASAPAIMLWHSLYLLYASICSSISHSIKRLELNEDLTTSLALAWLIQNCESPSAVDIALQSIAGAGQRTPKGPLLASRAAEQIMRRIVSFGPTSSDEEKSASNLYTRSLEVLGLNPGLEPNGGKRKMAGDLEVMVWDLKSKNERTIADLIKDGSFLPSEDNLEAMKIGNAAASQSLRFLTGEAKNSSTSLESITKLLSRHFESKDAELHPAAVQSLANAAVSHTSLSTVPELPPDLVGLCMKYCEQLIRELPGGGATASNLNFSTGVVFAICVLLHGRPYGGELPPLGTAQHINALRARALNAIHTLLDLDTEGPFFLVNIFWIGCSEILSNRSEYGLSEGTNDWESLERWCSAYSSDFLAGWGTPYIPSWSRDNKPVHSVRNKVLMAMSQVYELVSTSRSHRSSPTYLPESAHMILTIIACGNALDSWQTNVCNDLLSKFNFPRLSPEFMKRLESPTDKEDETVLSAIGKTYTRSAQPQARRHFAAAQLWLLFDLVGDSSSHDQQRLRDVIGRALEDSLRLQRRGFDKVKEDLETFIIEGYQEEHRLNEEKLINEENHSSSIWDTITNTLFSWRTHHDSHQPSLRFGTQFNRGIPGMGKHQRVYTARIVERIIESRHSQGNEDLDALLEKDFAELLPCFRKLRPTLVPLPPSRATSQASLVPQTEVASSSNSATNSLTPGAGHISVEVHNPVGFDPRGRYLD